ncbi:hypothetical protein DFH94DRAFT_686333 [Russula ochroleuca]|uniref:Uncharacterized protein n=1 Tax=Russula ochroleuca TaxID=152965 RepID=A0A9P5JUT4_9AGAM|nr:hypothetical protein DFH94DRAFT_686333 [Russula ochroleuca]
MNTWRFPRAEWSPCSWLRGALKRSRVCLEALIISRKTVGVEFWAHLIKESQVAPQLVLANGSERWRGVAARQTICWETATCARHMPSSFVQADTLPFSHAPPCQPPLLTIIVTVVTINLFTIPRGSNRSIAGGKSMLSIFCARRWLLQYPKVDYVSQMGVVLPFPSDSRDSEKCTWAHIQRSASREEVGSRQSIASGSTNCPGTSKAPPCTGRTSSDRRAGLGAISTSVIQRMNYWQ